MPIKAPNNDSNYASYALDLLPHDKEEFYMYATYCYCPYCRNRYLSILGFCGCRTFYNPDRAIAAHPALQWANPDFASYSFMFAPIRLEYDIERMAIKCVKEQISVEAFLDKTHELRAQLDTQPRNPGA